MKKIILPILVFMAFSHQIIPAQDLIKNPEFDHKVKTFLESRAGTWHDMNIPASDGKLLYDIILKNKYKSALEIGTSTGHSTIWIAWAMSKTGGKVITIEIDESRYKRALNNFKEAGLADYIDARLTDAHELVPELKGNFDFVFNDADKDWYTNYFKDVDPQLEVGGCYTAHNVWPGGGSRGTWEYLRYVKSLSNYKTRVNTSGNGLAISYKEDKRK